MNKTTKPEKVGVSSERLENIGESMRSLIEAKKIPGTVTLVARKGEVVHFEANGMRNIEKGWSDGIGTLINIGESKEDNEEQLIFEGQWEVKKLIEQLESRNESKT